MNPLISIIIPVYNSGHLIDTCIKSILAQTYHNFEIVLVDDKSPDNITIGILREWAQKDCRIRLLEKPVNGGSSRVDGLKIAQGEYICFSDQDDWMPKDAIEKMYNAAIAYDADVVIGQVSKAIKIGKFIKCFSPKSFCPHTGETLLHDELIGEYYESYFGHNIIPVNVWGKLYKKSLFERTQLPEPWPQVSAGDLVMSLSLHPFIERLTIIPDVVYYYYIGMPGASPKYLNKWLPDACKLFDYKWGIIDRDNITQAVTYQAIEMINYIKTYVHLCTVYDYANREKRMEVLGQELSNPVWKRVAVLGDYNSRYTFYVNSILNNDYKCLYQYLEERDLNVSFKDKIKHSFLRMCAKYKMFA